MPTRILASKTVDFRRLSTCTKVMTKIYGTPQNDYLRDSNDNDQVYGRSGDDQLVSNGGADVLDGGTGTDSARIDRSRASVSLTFTLTDPAKLTTLVGDGTTVINVETISLSGGSGDDRFILGAGNDSLDGGGGADWLDGGAGPPRAIHIFESAYADGEFRSESGPSIVRPDRARLDLHGASMPDLRDRAEPRSAANPGKAASP